MATREKEIAHFDRLDDELGDAENVDFTSNMYTEQVKVDVDLGTVYDADGEPVEWDEDAESRIFESVRLNLNGEVYDVTSKFINFLNTYEKGIEYPEQLIVDFRDEIRGQDYSTARLEFVLEQVSNLSEDGETQEDTEITVVAKEKDKGNTNRVSKINDSVQSLSEGDDQFSVRQNGRYDFVLIQDEDGILDRIHSEVILPGDEEEVVEESARSLRNMNVQEAGTRDLDSDFYLVDIAEAGNFHSDRADRIDFNVETSEEGSVRAWTVTERQLEA